MSDAFGYILLCLPAFIGLMFGAFSYPYMGIKGASLKRKAIEAGIVGGLICLIGYSLLAYFDVAFLQSTLEARMALTIKLSVFMMFGTWFIAYGSIDQENI